MEDGRKKYGTKFRKAFRIGEMAVRIAEKDGCADGCRDGCKDRKLNIIIDSPKLPTLPFDELSVLTVQKSVVWILAKLPRRGSTVLACV